MINKEITEFTLTVDNCQNVLYHVWWLRQFGIPYKINRDPNTQYVISLSYGKDSLCCVQACRELGLPLDACIHAEVWATDTIPAELPPMVEFKAKADQILKERYNIDVIRVCATKPAPTLSKLTFEDCFYKAIINPRKTTVARGEYRKIYGFPTRTENWCNSQLKARVLDSHLRVPANQGLFSSKPDTAGGKINTVKYLGIAADEPIRIARHYGKKGIVMPLYEIGYDEPFCRKWSEDNDLLSPTYTTSTRGGCWFCHNQGVEQLRQLRHNYPDLWALLLKWDNDSPVSFHTDGRTVHDFDKRFCAEDSGLVDPSKRFYWKTINKNSQQNGQDTDH